MPFQPGSKEHLKADRSKPRIIRQQLIAALNEAADGGPTKLRRVVDAIIDEAMTGNVAAFNAIADRVDGKAPAELTVNDGNSIRDASTAELLARVEATLRRIEGVADGDSGQAAGEDESADVRQLN